MRTPSRIAAGLLTLTILALIARRIPVASLAAAFRDADCVTFLALMVANTLFYFCWDTLVLKTVIGWFHGEVPYHDLLPVRAASYVVGFFNTNAGRGALAAYLWRRLRVPFLELSGTVIFLVLTEYTQLVVWAMLGVLGFRAQITTSLLPVAGAVAALGVVLLGCARLHVTAGRACRWLFAPRDWQLFRTLRRVSAVRCAKVIVLRAPMFVVSLAAHYYGARAFGIPVPFGQMLTFLPVVFMVAALPVTLAHLGTTQAAWILFFGQYAPTPRLLAFSLAAHFTFAATRALLGLVWLPQAYSDLTAPSPRYFARANSATTS